MENVGHNDLNFYHFLKMQRNIPSLGVDEDWDFKVQSRVNQLESEYEAGIYNPSNIKESKISENKKPKNLSKRTKQKHRKRSTSQSDRSRSQSTSGQKENL